MYDNYSHEDSSVMYVEENIPGPTENSTEFTQLMNCFNSQLVDHCRCDQLCAEATCNCLQKSGGLNYSWKTENGILSHMLNFDKKDFKISPIIECNSLCQCSENCGNRRVQKGPFDRLVVKICSIESKGLGLFTKTLIGKGTFICEYAGEVITKSEALKRHESNNLKGNMNYIYCLNEHCNGRLTQTFIDPSSFGNIGRYINHSCDPNCQIIPVRVDTPIPRLAIFSSIDILPNTEITFDYGSFNSENIDFEFTKSTEVMKSRKKCECNSQRCSGSMPFDIY